MPTLDTQHEWEKIRENLHERIQVEERRLKFAILYSSDADSPNVTLTVISMTSWFHWSNFRGHPLINNKWKYDNIYGWIFWLDTYVSCQPHSSARKQWHQWFDEGKISVNGAKESNRHHLEAKITPIVKNQMDSFTQAAKTKEEEFYLNWSTVRSPFPKSTVYG